MEVGVDRHLLKKCSLVPPRSFSLIARNSSTPRPKSCDSVPCQTSTSTVRVPQYPASLLLAILFKVFHGIGIVFAVMRSQHIFPYGICTHQMTTEELLKVQVHQNSQLKCNQFSMSPGQKMHPRLEWERQQASDR